MNAFSPCERESLRKLIPIVSTVSWETVGEVGDGRPEAAPEYEVLCREELNELYRELDRLRPEEKELLFLRFYQGNTLKECAESFGKSVSRIWDWERKTLNLLRLGLGSPTEDASAAVKAEKTSKKSKNNQNNA